LHDIERQLAKAQKELQNLYDAVLSGAIRPETLAKPIDEHLNLINKLEINITSVKKEMERALRIPEVTESEVTDILDTVHKMLDTTEPSEGGIEPLH
jgi:chromosome segregation ATPase